MAELHRNHYPYADEFIYLVTGAEIKDNKLSFESLASSIIVGRRPMDVSRRWQQMHPSSNERAITCVSLTQIKQSLGQMAAAAANPDKCRVIPPSGFFRVGLSARQVWMVRYEGPTGNNMESEVVLAYGVDDIQAWAKKNGKSIATVANKDVLQAVANEMIKVQQGKANIEHYGEGPEDVKELFSMLDNRSPEEVEKDDEGYLRRMKYQNGGV